MRICGVVLVALASCGMLAGAEHPDFSGTWRLSPDAAPPDASVRLTIKQSADELRIRSTEAPADAITEISCNTIGKDCEAKINGKPVKVSYYFNGSALVGWITEGKKAERVRKVRRTLSPDGAKMTVEIEQISPPDPARQTVVYMRDQQLAGVAATEHQQ